MTWWTPCSSYDSKYPTSLKPCIAVHIGVMMCPCKANFSNMHLTCYGICPYLQFATSSPFLTIYFISHNFKTVGFCIVHSIDLQSAVWVESIQESFWYLFIWHGVKQFLALLRGAQTPSTFNLLTSGSYKTLSSQPLTSEKCRNCFLANWDEIQALWEFGWGLCLPKTFISWILCVILSSIQ